MSEAAPPSKLTLKQRFDALLAEYGKFVLIVYFTVFGLTLAGFAVAIAAGVEVESAKGGAGVLGAAYVATKLTQPVRILITLVLTPVIAKLWAKIRPPKPPPAASAP